MAATRYASFKEFWPFYVGEHSLRLTRRLHFIGTALSIIFLTLTIFSSFYFIFAAIFSGYGFAWIAHFFIEKNRPATFQYPLWSLIADYRMFFLMCAGRMDQEVQRCL